MNLVIPLLAIAVSSVAASTIVKRDGNVYSVIQIAGGNVIDFPSPNGQPAAAGTQLYLYPYNGGNKQFYRFVPTNQYGDDNYYTIVNLNTGYCLDTLNRGTGNGAAVGLFNCVAAAENQIWSLKPFNGGYLIVSMMSNRCLNDYGGARASGDNIALFDCNTDDVNSLWNINDAAMVLDFPSFNGPAAARTQLQLYSNNGGQAQQYGFVPTSDGYYNVINQETGYCLDVSNNKVDNGSPVALFTCNGQANQKWSVQPKGLYAGSIPAWVVGKQSGRCLNAFGGTFNSQDKSANTVSALALTKVPFNFLLTVVQLSLCAYHSGVWIGDIAGQATNELIYGVMPDLNGCGCGGDSVFEAQTLPASHELIEAVTDPWGGYRDPVTAAEIGDLCSYRPFSITGYSGNSYVIQKFWSNIANTCVE
ncbi:hypothetical protein HDU76_006481 [Blyttiomyces sp. JEL0837]|nr:hypothetical protein HDU76_006481 [Blyttiomyces sp. JEL0837]